jgi:hypothetical protein
MKLSNIVFLTINLFFNPLPAYSQQGNEQTLVPDISQLEVIPPSTSIQVYEEIDLMSLLKEIDETKNNHNQPPHIRLKRLDSLYQLQRVQQEIKLAGGAGDYVVPDYVVNMINPTFSNGCGDGKIDLVFTGGRPPFDVEWRGPNGFSHSISDVSGNNEGEDISNLIPGIYTLKTTDSRCGVREEKFEIICTYKY